MLFHEIIKGSYYYKRKTTEENKIDRIIKEWRLIKSQN